MPELDRFDPDARKMLDLSLREALMLGHARIRPEHILLACLRGDEGIIAQALGPDDDGQMDLRRDIRGRIIRALHDQADSRLDSYGNLVT